MDIDARIKRRQRRDGELPLVKEYDPLSPVMHIDEPVGCGPLIERLLDHFDPIFTGNLPPNGYVYGPGGSGKTAVVTALFTHLEQLPTENRSVIHTTTRPQSERSPSFVYIDTRQKTSEFAFYHAVLDALIEESIPEHGIGTETLKARLDELLDDTHLGVVVAVDHVGEPRSISETTLVDLLAGLPSTVSWLAISRMEPTTAQLSEYTAVSIGVEPYQDQMLADVLMTRASVGLTTQAITQELAAEIAEWADGNAHNALAALFVATVRADSTGASEITTADVSAAIDEIPSPCVPLGIVLSLPANRQSVLRELIDLSQEERSSVTATTAAIAGADSVDLSPGTVKRFLYEMAEAGVVERVQATARSGQGRPPSRVEPRFPPTVFRRLYDFR
jgi:Cdc6-like AAA superfamily ATPase